MKYLNFIGKIDSVMYDKKMQELFELEKYYEDLVNYNAKFKDQKDMKPIDDLLVTIDSMGGNLSMFTSAVTIFAKLPCKIITRGLNNVASTALYMFLLGDERQLNQNTLVVYHELSYGMNDNLNTQINHVDYCKSYQNYINEFILDRTSISKATLKSQSGKDWYISTDDAMKLGIATSINDPLKIYAKRGK